MSASEPIRVHCLKTCLRLSIGLTWTLRSSKAGSEPSSSTSRTAECRSWAIGSQPLWQREPEPRLTVAVISRATRATNPSRLLCRLVPLSLLALRRALQHKLGAASARVVAKRLGAHQEKGGLIISLSRPSRPVNTSDRRANVLVPTSAANLRHGRASSPSLAKAMAG